MIEFYLIARNVRSRSSSVGRRSLLLLVITQTSLPLAI